MLTPTLLLKDFEDVDTKSRPVHTMKKPRAGTCS